MTTSEPIPESKAQRIGRFAGLRCPHCKYDLTGLLKPRCPECGRYFNPVLLRRLAKGLGGEQNAVIRITARCLFTASILMLVWQAGTELYIHWVLMGRVTATGSSLWATGADLFVRTGLSVPCGAHLILFVAGMLWVGKCLTARAPYSGLLSLLAAAGALVGIYYGGHLYMYFMD